MKYKKGFTLIEVLVGTAVFLVVALSAYNAYTSLFQLASLNQNRLLGVQLANEQFEIIRNMPYNNIGIVGGIPSGTLQGSKNLVRGGIDFTVGTVVRNIDLSFDGALGSSTPDTNPTDNKLVEVTVSCASCKNFTPIVITSQIAPKNLETTSVLNGAIEVQVLNANGNPVRNASVRVTNSYVSPTVSLLETTDNDGVFKVLDVPPSSNRYHIVVTKDGYSVDQTYPIGGSGNPNPVKSDATVASQQTTKVSFAIDTLASLTFTSVSPTCTSTPSVGFKMMGEKMIGDDVPKYSQTLATNGSGSLALGSLEWDLYSISSAGSSYDVAGMSLPNPINVSPGSSESVQLVIVPKTPRSIMVTVRDDTNNQAIDGASVNLSKSSGYNETIITSDTSLGACTPPGQVIFTDLSPGNYTLTVSKSGYVEFSKSIVITSGWVEERVNLGH